MLKRAFVIGCLIVGTALLVSCGNQQVPQPGSPGRPTRVTPSPGAPASVAAVQLPASLRPDSDAFRKSEFAPGDAAKPPTWFWSMGDGTFHGPSVQVPASDDVSVTVHLGGFFPAKVNPRLVVTASGQSVFDQTLNGATLFKDKTIGPFRVPASVHRGQLDLVWKVDTWIPAVVGTNRQDARHLGLDIASIDIAKAP
jgi:hypothetical protein